MKIRVLYPQQHLSAGEVVEARKIPRDGMLFDANPNYQVTEGKYLGRIIKFFDANPLEERTYTEEEYGRLRETNKVVYRELEQTRQALGRAIDDLATHAQTLVDLHNELVSEREGKKVALPMDVAEAIDYFRENPGRFTNRDFAIKLFNPVESGDNNHSLAIKKYVLDPENGDRLLEALVNDYTIEEEPTTEDKIRNSLSAALEDMRVTSPVPIDRLAKILTLAVREVLAEEQAKETTT
ncbi:hypothetical protein EJP82_01050 [Paenibacillus anaericanus]|uniref:Uncharacterized protein n=1 Tax=Paenibacillus anaericanus TaxID=170367 RepID=A0A3S1DZG7_9BACL|nr:hypothetical protein [Paenibacillus anaericanus]RUT48561.1 hypothetical protein EJP82_01050 [Paenibacillus anaericanus]